MPEPVTDPERDLAVILERVTRTLAEAGIENPRADAQLLLAHVLGVSRGRLTALAVIGATLSETDADALTRFVERRRAREPLQHITGTAHFRSLELAVGPGVFVPRPETEFVAQLAIDAARSMGSPAPIVVDLGTGSGALALAVATEVPHARVFAIENSADAFAWTQRNFSAVNSPNAQLVFGDLVDGLAELDGTVSVVVSNPPYIPDAAIPRDPEVRLHDPAAALYGGGDGMRVMHQVSRTAHRLLHPGGTLIVEHGDLQGDQVRALLASDGWHAPATHRDLTLRDRAATALR